MRKLRGKKAFVVVKIPLQFIYTLTSNQNTVRPNANLSIYRVYPVVDGFFEFYVWFQFLSIVCRPFVFHNRWQSNVYLCDHEIWPMVGTEILPDERLAHHSLCDEMVQPLVSSCWFQQPLVLCCRCCCCCTIFSKTKAWNLCNKTQPQMWYFDKISIKKIENCSLNDDDDYCHQLTFDVQWSKCPKTQFANFKSVASNVSTFLQGKKSENNWIWLSIIYCMFWCKNCQQFFLPLFTLIMEFSIWLNDKQQNYTHLHRRAK